MPVEAGVIQGSVLGPILFILYIADINDYLPAGANTEKYADDIISYVIGESSATLLPQQIVDAVQRWCTVNKMRLNVDKCKVINIPVSSKKAAPQPQPQLTLIGQTLEVVSTYKYLGVEINDKLDNNQQWNRVHSLISSFPFLVKQLKRRGFREEILISAYKSLVLSHFIYSSTILDSASAEAKNEMSSFQNRILRIIDIDHATALLKYNICEISKFIADNCLKQVSRILANPHHSLTISLARPPDAHERTTRSNTANFKLAIPRTHGAKFNNNPVIKTLRYLRDGERRLIYMT
jgi:hypothetical protein